MAKTTLREQRIMTLAAQEKSNKEIGEETPTTIRSKNDIIGPETVTLDDGTKTEVSLVSTITYKYDQQGRIVEMLDKSPLGSYFLERYTYDPKGFIRREETYVSMGDSKLYSKADIIWIDAQGLRTVINKLGQSLFAIVQIDN